MAAAKPRLGSIPRDASVPIRVRSSRASSEKPNGSNGWEWRNRHAAIHGRHRPTLDPPVLQLSRCRDQGGIKSAWRPHTRLCPRCRPDGLVFPHPEPDRPARDLGRTIATAGPSGRRVGTGARFPGNLSPRRSDRAALSNCCSLFRCWKRPGCCRTTIWSPPTTAPYPRWQSRDEVAFIMPADTDMGARRRPYVCPGPLTEAGVIAEYATSGASWSKDSSGAVSIGYHFDDFTAKIDQNTQAGQIALAFAQWMKFANVTITPVAQAAQPRSADLLFATYCARRSVSVRWAGRRAGSHVLPVSR